MFRSSVAVISMKQEDGSWKTLPLVEVEPFPTHVKVGASRLIFAKNSKGGVELNVQGGPNFTLPMGQKVTFVDKQSSFFVHVKKDIIKSQKETFSRFLGYSWLFHLILLIAASAYMMLNPVQTAPKKQDKSVNLAEVQQLLKKVEEKKRPKPEKPEPQVVKKIEPKPELAKPQKVVKKPKLQVKPKVSPQPKAPVKVAKTKVKPKPVAKGRKGRAKPKVAARARGGIPSGKSSKVKATAAAKAKLAKSLSFLSSGKGDFKLANNNYKESGRAVAAAAGSQASVESAKGKKALQGMAKGVADGPIQTRGNRGVGKAVAFSGSEYGKGLNNVQGKVQLASLYGAPGGSLNSSVGGMSLSGKGKVSKSLIEKVLARHIDKLRYCYERELLRDASIGGRLTMQWMISSAGLVSKVRVSDSQINHRKLHNCVAGEIAKIHFPKIKGGAVKIEYPFVFTSQAI